MTTPPTVPMLIFLDTEFTDFEYSRLISIALVAEDGREFYAKLSDGWSKLNCSGFVLTTVLPLTEGEHAVTREEAAQALFTWLESMGRPVRVVTDAPEFDWELMKTLLGDKLPSNLFNTPLEFYSTYLPELEPLLSEARFKALEGKAAHHALVDAHALKTAWKVYEVNNDCGSLDAMKCS